MCVLNIFKSIWSYIINNSIDFISIAASVLVAIETNKWIESKKDKKIVKQLAIDLYTEILSIYDKLLRDKEIAQENILNSKLTLRIEPYKFPIWSSILQTNKIDLLTNKKFYKDLLDFYSNLVITNDWENILTEFILLNKNDDINEYKHMLINQISEERINTIQLAEDVIIKLKEFLNTNGCSNNISK